MINRDGDREAIKIFVSYSHEDEELRKKLANALSVVRHERLIDDWCDHQIMPGDMWEQEIMRKLEEADIILLLLSRDFLASRFCYLEEMRRAMKRHEEGTARVIPILLRPCFFKPAPFGKIQGLPEGLKAVSACQNSEQDAVLAEIAEAIHNVAVATIEGRLREANLRGADLIDFRAFRDGDESFAPEMVVMPAGKFMMGSFDNDQSAHDNEKPQHEVTIAYRFAVGRFPVTFAEWDACVNDRGIGNRPNDHGWGRDRRPVINVSWYEAKEYLSWLSWKTGGQKYRLLSEAEWEYVARANTTTQYWWGDEIKLDNANYRDSGFNKTVNVFSNEPNPFKLYSMLGNVWEWTEDCWNDSYRGAPNDGSAWITADHRRRVHRGGSWVDGPRGVRCAFRAHGRADLHSYNVGFRVARNLEEAVVPKP